MVPPTFHKPHSHSLPFFCNLLERETNRELWPKATLRSPPATTPTQSTKSRRRSVSPRTTTSSTPTDHPPTPPPESSPRPFPTPRRPSRSSPTGPRATIVGNAHIGLRRYDDAVSAYKNGLEIDLNNEVLKSGLAAASGTRIISPFGDVFAGPEMWARLESDPTTRAFLQQGDFKNKMLDVQENPSTLNRHLKDPSIVQALGVLLNVKLRRPNSAEDAEMTEEEPEPEDMEVPEEEREGRAIFASRSPFDPVEHDIKVFVPSQANNAYIFPGFGLGLIMSGTIRLHDDKLLAASEALAAQVTEENYEKGLIYPPFSNIRNISAHIAAKVAAKYLSEFSNTIHITENTYRIMCMS